MLNWGAAMRAAHIMLGACYLTIAFGAVSAGAEQNAAPASGSYFLIPVRGAIGREFTSRRMEGYLRRAKELSATAVVLEVDTGGGSVSEAESIIDLIIQHKDLRFVALVQKALSAGAAITLACKEVYVTEQATLGGAVSYTLGPDGIPLSLPRDVAEKFQSAWRAVCRKAAQNGGHPSLIAEAMVDPDFSLTMRRAAQKLVFERDGQGEVIKAKGRILTLTAREAVNCGLAKAMVADHRALGEQLGFAEWTMVGGAALATGGVAVDPRESPEGLYQAASALAASLRMFEKMTSLQEEAASKEWDNWLKKEALLGRNVRWTMTLIEAREQDASQIERQLEYATTRLSMAQRKAAQRTRDYHGPIYYERPTFPDAPQEVRAWAKVVQRLKGILRNIAAYPLAVICRGGGEPRVLIGAYVSQADRALLGKFAPEDEVTVEGRLEDVSPYFHADGTFVIIGILDRGRIVGATEKTPQKAGTPVSSEEIECSSWISMARNFIRAGMPEKAKPYLSNVIDKYSESPYALEARELLKSLEGE